MNCNCKDTNKILLRTLTSFHEDTFFSRKLSQLLKTLFNYYLLKIRPPFNYRYISERLETHG